MARNPSVWTTWYNTNHPWESSGDVEKTESILKHHGPVCPSDYVITSSQCKHIEKNILFDRSMSRDLVPDVLRVFCTNEGVTCRDKDQSDGHTCGDYGIRYNCEYAGEVVINAHMFNRHSVSLYYILLVIPILITVSRLLWLFVIRPWRDRRTGGGRPLPRQNRWPKSETLVDLNLAKPPPSYHDLFGETSNQRPEGLVIARDFSVCSKCQAQKCAFTSDICGTSASGSRSLSGQNDENLPFSELGVSTISSALSEQDGHFSSVDSLSPPSISYCTHHQCPQTNPNVLDNTRYLHSLKNYHLQKYESSITGSNLPMTEFISRTTCVAERSQFCPLPHTELTSSDSSNCQSTASGVSSLILAINSNQLQPLGCDCACHSSVNLNVIGEQDIMKTEQSLSGLSRGRCSPDFEARRVHFSSSVTNLRRELPTYDEALTLLKTNEGLKVQA